MPHIQVPPDSTGKLVETATPNVATSLHREVYVVGGATTTDYAPVTTTGGLLTAVSNTIRSLSSGTITLSSNPTVVSASSGLIQLTSAISLSSGLVTLSSVHTIVSASSGLIQLTSAISISSGIITSTAATNPWSSAPGFNMPIVSASSGLIQLTSAISISSGTITSTAATNPWSSAPGFNMPSVSASSGLVQIIPTSSAAAMTIAAYISSSSGNETLITGSPAAFYGYSIFNSTAAPQYVKFFNTSSAPTVGASTAGLFMTLLIPGSTGGGGANMISPFPLNYSTKGLGFTVVSAPGSTSTAITLSAGDLVLNLYYL